MEVIHEDRKLVHFDIPLVKIDTPWRPFGWDASIEVDGFLVDIKDIFYKFKFIRPDQLKDEWFQLFWWQEYTKLENISNAFYGSPQYWWTIPLVNNKINPIFEFPLSVEELEDLVDIFLDEKDQNGNYKFEEYIIAKLGFDISKGLLANYNIHSFEGYLSEAEWDVVTQTLPASAALLFNTLYFNYPYVYFDIAKVNLVANQIDPTLYNTLIDRANINTNQISTHELKNRYEDYLFEFRELFFQLVLLFLIAENEKKRSIIIVKPQFLGDFITMLSSQIAQNPTTDGFFNFQKND